ncbi:MAG: hypothetical protein KGN84_01360 [Acidobacteriota bacterium]|nr:hypothetical protein [Acidobacteriota bacterium]
MTKTATPADEAARPRAVETPTPDEIHAQLNRILSSPVFHGSKRCQQFLEYVCDRALAGDAGALKERSIAIEVFGRRPDAAGHGEDTIVRVGAREVRKRLAQYYVTAEGSASPVVIDLAPGSYVPEFRHAVSRPSLAPDPASLRVEIHPVPPAPAVIEEAQTKPARFSWRTIALAASVLAISIAGLTFAHRSATGASSAAFERFWGPVFQSGQPLLIGVGHPIVYLPSHRAVLLNESRLPPSPTPNLRKLELDPDELNGSDIVPVLNQYVGFGDMVAANEVTQLLARRSRGVRLMLASSIPFADLRTSAAYLIGSFSNQWTGELSRAWRFQFRWTPRHQPVFVDTQSQPPREWSIPSGDDGSTPDDYSLICRLRNSPTGGFLIVSAGIKQFGTEAAGRILADSASLDPILAKLPGGWEDKNLQILLHMRVLGNTPAQPELVAWHVW